MEESHEPEAVNCNITFPGGDADSSSLSPENPNGGNVSFQSNDATPENSAVGGRRSRCASLPPRISKSTIPPSPDIIFKDIKMPLMDGLEFLRWVRTSAFRDLHVMITTCSMLATEMEVDQKLGIQGWIVKPSDWRELAENLSREPVPFIREN